MKGPLQHCTAANHCGCEQSRTHSRTLTAWRALEKTVTTLQAVRTTAQPTSAHFQLFGLDRGHPSDPKSQPHEVASFERCRHRRITNVPNSAPIISDIVQKVIKTDRGSLPLQLWSISWASVFRQYHTAITGISLHRLQLIAYRPMTLYTATGLHFIVILQIYLYVYLLRWLRFVNL